jgi:hypothetical protein
MSQIGKIVEIKNIHFLVLKRFKVLDDPLYLCITLKKDAVLDQRNNLWLIQDQNNNTWYIGGTPMIMSDQMLEKLDAIDYVEEIVTNSLIFDKVFFANTIEILGEVIISILSRKYPKEKCIEAYQKLLQMMFG